MKPRSSKPQKARSTRATTVKPAAAADKPSAQERASVPQAGNDKSALLLPERTPLPEIVSVAIGYFQPGAQNVHVAGDFNGWRTDTHALKRQQDGHWSIDLDLKPGRYEYRFMVDGEWKDDPMAPRYVANPFGGLNAVIEVQPS